MSGMGSCPDMMGEAVRSERAGISDSNLRALCSIHCFFGDEEGGRGTTAGSDPAERLRACCPRRGLLPEAIQRRQVNQKRRAAALPGVGELTAFARQAASAPR